MRDGVGYIRYSDHKQSENHSEDIQKRVILERAKKEGIQIIKWRYDEAESAYRKSAVKRKNMRELLHDAKEVDAVIFYDESRISRKIYDFYHEIYRPIKEQYPQVKFYSTQSPGEWDPNDPTVQMKLVIAAEESAIKSTRAMDAQLSLLSDQIRPGARAPVGYDLVNGVLEVNVEAPIVSFIFDCASWGHSNAAIATFLNENNVKTKYISTWHSSTINYILTNTAYAGDLRWKVKQAHFMTESDDGIAFKLFEDNHEPIVSPAMFAIVNQVKQYKTKYGKLDTSFLLRNLIYCGHCKSMLEAKDHSPKSMSKQYLVYRCTKCKTNFQAADLHHEVIGDLKSKLTSNFHQMIHASKSALSAWLKTLNSLVESLKLTEERIMLNERFINPQEQNEDLTKMMADAKKIMQKKKQKLNQTMEKIHLLNNDEALYEIYSHFKHAEISSLFNVELRTLCLTFINRITVTTKNNDYSLSIDYRLNPFVELENSTDQITEDFLKQLPEKPKGRKPTSEA